LSPFEREREHLCDSSPHTLRSADFDAGLIFDFLNRLEVAQHNAIRSRNARLAAVRRPLLAPQGSDNYEKASHGAVEVFLGDGQHASEIAAFCATRKKHHGND
jgi:hypothetical protein